MEAQETVTYDTKKCSVFTVRSKDKTISVQAWAGPEGSSRLMHPGILDTWHMKVVTLSTLCTGRLNLLLLPPPPSWHIIGTHVCYKLSRPQGHSAAGRS